MSLSVIILTFNEALHIERCIKSLELLQANVYIIDSYSTDNTIKISQSLGAVTFKNPFVNQAQQFQWAIDNCGINTAWILRMDADELIDNQLVNNINNFLATDNDQFNGAIFNRRHIFLGKWIRFGGRYPLPMLRLFRKGTAHVEQRWMDEHIILDSGSAKTLAGGFSDENINTISWFIDKHNKYATREMIDIMIKRLSPSNSSQITAETGTKIRLKRFFKEKLYEKLPYFIRPLLYFLFRYFIQLGFLDGSRGFAYHFMQGFWYRALVDLKCMEVEKEWKNCLSYSEKIKVLEKYSGYSLNK